jgi:hypothetical protein
VLTLCLQRTAVAAAVLAALWALLAAERAPVQFFAYTGFAVAAWWWAIGEASLASVARAVLRPRVLLGAALAVAVLELLVASYFQRALLSLGALGLALLAPVMGVRGRVAGGWAAACVALAVFPVLPVSGMESTALVCVGAGLLAVGGFVAALRLPVSRRARVLLAVQAVLVAAAGVLVWHTSLELAARRPLPGLNRALSWAIAGAGVSPVARLWRVSSQRGTASAWLLPVLSPPLPLPRAVSVLLGLGAPYVLLSTSCVLPSLACLLHRD